jgi:hypothetical protein
MARGLAPQRSPAPPPKPKKYINFGGFKKMNTKVIRQALPEDQLAWLENMMIVGDNNIQSVPAALPPIATVPSETVFRTYWANFSAIDYIIMFTVAGAGWALNLTSNVLIEFAPDGTFTTPDMTVFASERILIIDPGTAGYCTWDGTLFVKSGGISPNINVTNGGQYSFTPLITITGGSGTGATAHAVMGGTGTEQFVAGIVLDTPGAGYLPGDTIVVGIQLGAVTATATARVWPQVTGITITTFAGRVWWASAPAFPAGSNYRQLNFTGTAGYDDTDPANAAGQTTITDQDLAHNITCLRGLNNYLYIIGDNALKQIGSITVGSGSVTLFTILTIASDIGTTFIQTVLSFNRYVVFANRNGVYGIFGASVQKISDDLDGIFELVDFGLDMSASLNDIHFGITAGGAIHCYLLLVRYNDPVQGPRTIMCGFDGKSWFVVSQGNALSCITSLPSGTTFQWETYAAAASGTGFVINQLLQDDTTAVSVKLITSLTPHQSVQVAKQVLHIGVAFNFAIPPTGISTTLDSENNSVGTTFVAPGGNAGFFLLHSDIEGYGHYLGATMETQAIRCALSAIVIEYVDADVWGDVFPAPTVVLLTDEQGTVILTTEGGVPLTPP